jgi:hypothetical protein
MLSLPEYRNKRNKSLSCYPFVCPFVKLRVTKGLQEAEAQTLTDSTLSGCCCISFVMLSQPKYKDKRNN